MGFYLNKTRKGPMGKLGKLQDLFEDGAEIIGHGLENKPEFQPGLVALVHNGAFEAARFIAEKIDYDIVSRSETTRPIIWLKYPSAVDLIDDSDLVKKRLGLKTVKILDLFPKKATLLDRLLHLILPY